jgi:hypothetical protein
MISTAVAARIAATQQLAWVVCLAAASVAWDVPVAAARAAWDFSEAVFAYCTGHALGARGKHLLHFTLNRSH